MDPTAQEKADRIFEEALERSGARDPREYYRDRLRELKQTDPAAYREAVSYYQETLIPAVAAGEADPLTAWLEYGIRIASLTVEGRTVEIDPSGRRLEYRPPVAPDRMVLHLPDARGGRAIAVGLPITLSDAQQATFDLLVAGRQRLRE